LGARAREVAQHRDDEMDFPGEKLAAKLLDVLSGTVSSVARPWLIKREARAKAIAKADTKRIERLAQEKVRQEMKAVRCGEALITADYRVEATATDEERNLAQIRADYLSALEASGLPRHRLIEVERQINLDQIAALAIDQADEDAEGEADDVPIDPDWFAQWRNRAQDVSNEDMQRLWAKVLKGQAKTSASFSIHTIDFLSRMSRTDAELLATVGNVAIDGHAIFKRGQPILDRIGLTFDRLLYLEDLSIVGGVSPGIGGLNINKLVSMEYRGFRAVTFRCNAHVLVLYEPKKSKLEKVELPVYSISTTGRELLGLATCNTPPDYLIEVGKHLIDRFNHAQIGEFGGHLPGGLIKLNNVSPILTSSFKEPDASAA
jgi:hypothetical protein